MSRKPFVTRGRRAPYSQLGDWVVIAGGPPQAPAVYWALEAMTWRTRDEEGQLTEDIDRHAEPSRETLAEMFGYSRPQSIDPYLDWLESIGAIDKIENPGYPNTYVVHQTPPDDYEGPQTMGQWHTRRAARKKAEKAAADAAKTAKRGKRSTAAAKAPNAKAQVDTCAVDRTPPQEGCAPDRTPPMRSTAQGVCAVPHTKEEALPEPVKNPPTPRRAGGEAAPAAQPEISPGEHPARCQAHRRQSCRVCGLSPRVQAQRERDRVEAEERAAELAGRACPMCSADPVKPGVWWRHDRGLPVSPPLPCDHSTSTEQALAAREAADAVARADAVIERTAAVSASAEHRAALRTGWQTLKNGDAPGGVAQTVAV